VALGRVACVAVSLNARAVCYNLYEEIFTPERRVYSVDRVYTRRCHESVQSSVAEATMRRVMMVMVCH